MRSASQTPATPKHAVHAASPAQALTKNDAPCHNNPIWHHLATRAQPKLTVSVPDDPYEREADRVANQVMGIPEPQLQRKCSACSNGSSPKDEEEQQPLIQRRAEPSPQPAQVSSDFASTLGHGRPLDTDTRAFFEPRFGQDFSHVQVHTDGSADASAKHVSALAFTLGRDIAFRAGQYSPSTQDGRRLLAHELAHVVQQGGGSHNLPKTTGKIQRKQPPAPVPGSATDQVLQALSVVSPVAGVGDFPAAFRVLDGLAVNELMNTLTDLEMRFQLDLLIANSGSAAPFNQVRLVTAMEVVRQSHGPGANLQTAQATILASGLPAADQLVMNNYLLLLRPAGADQRVLPPGPAAALPSADLAREIGYELDPSSRPAPAAPVPAPAPAAPPGAPAPAAPPPPARIPWDGRTGAPGDAAARATMQTQLFSAFDAYLTFNRPETLAALARPRVAFTAAPPPAGGAASPPTGVVDIANQARSVLEARYATSMDAAASSPTQVSDRSVRQATGPGQNIFDPYSEADRIALTGSPDLASGVAWWLFENDRPGAAGAAGTRRFATEILAIHHYSVQDPGAEQFRWDVARAYAAASTLAPTNTRQLIDYRLTGWSESGSRGITLQSSFDPGANRNQAELVQRWEIFKSATHESLHLRAHPGFVAAEQGRGAMMEGFTEMFTVATLNTDVFPRARAGSIEPLRHTVEGALSPAAPDASIITDRITPPQYAAHREQAERIRDGGTPAGGAAHAGVGEAAVRSAFFQGHVEYLGLAPSGSQLAALPAPGAPRQMRIPGGMTGLDDLAWRSGVPRTTIERDNPGITDSLPATAVLAGCREHWVVTGETRANISSQNGISEAELVRANPDIPTDASFAWPALSQGQRILVPVH